MRERHPLSPLQALYRFCPSKSALVQKQIQSSVPMAATVSPSQCTYVPLRLPACPDADLASSAYYYLLVDYWLTTHLHDQTEPPLKLADRLHHR